MHMLARFAPDATTSVSSLKQIPRFMACVTFAHTFVETTLHTKLTHNFWNVSLISSVCFQFQQVFF